ncbi:MAG: hypothetical protein GC159_09260 [Phycisphaera sp.]|nr:hypothetical protein [Phycisphaera sp.]
MQILLSLITLIIVTLLTLTLRQADLGDGAAVRLAITCMTVGFVMIGAWLTGRLFDRWKLPKISGYLLFGLVVGPSFWSVLIEPMLAGYVDSVASGVLPLVPREQVEGMRFIKDLAISLIAITAGGEIQIKWLAGQFRRVATLTFAAVFVVGAIVAGVVALASLAFPVVPLADGATLGATEMAVLVVVIGLIASGNSPAVAIALMSELRADGPLSRTTLAVTVCKDLVIVVLFATLLAVGKGLLDENTAVSGHFLLAVGAELGGSILIGVVTGFVMGWFVTHVEQHLVFFIVGACFLFALLGEQHPHLTIGGEDHAIHLHPLLIALAAGLVMRNFQPDETEPLFHTIEHMSLPVYAVFFAVAGAELNLDVFTSVAAVLGVVTVLLARALAVWGAITLTGRWVGLEAAWRGKLWLCLIPQAGVTLALATLAYETFESTAWAKGLLSLLLGLVAVHALVGPIAYRWALISSGEAGQGDGGSAH